MAIDNANGSVTLIKDLVAELQANEPVAARKANTVTNAIGTVATLLATAGATWLESGTSLPSWFPVLVLVLGMFGTTYGVSKTKNGMTDSIANMLHDALAERIDLKHVHGPEELPLSEGAPKTELVDEALELRSLANRLIDDHLDPNKL